MEMGPTIHVQPAAIFPSDLLNESKIHNKHADNEFENYFLTADEQSKRFTPDICEVFDVETSFFVQYVDQLYSMYASRKCLTKGRQRKIMRRK